MQAIIRTQSIAIPPSACGCRWQRRLSSLRSGDNDCPECLLPREDKTEFDEYESTSSRDTLHGLAALNQGCSSGLCHVARGVQEGLITGPHGKSYLKKQIPLHKSRRDVVSVKETNYRYRFQGEGGSKTAHSTFLRETSWCGLWMIGQFGT